jgi:hypothetical protein
MPHKPTFGLASAGWKPALQVLSFGLPLSAGSAAVRGEAESAGARRSQAAAGNAQRYKSPPSRSLFLGELC